MTAAPRATKPTNLETPIKISLMLYESLPLPSSENNIEKNLKVKPPTRRSTNNMTRSSNIS